MPKDNSASKPGGSDPATAVHPDWMKFPALSAVFDQSPSGTIAYLEAKQKEYESLQTSGTSSDRMRARLIANCYARTRALVQELEAAQAKLLQQQETKSVTTR